MNQSSLIPSIYFEHGLDELEEFEMKFKGYRSDVIVTLPNKKRYRLCFYDSVRLSQDIADEEMIYDPGLVIIREVTKEYIEKAVKQMWETNYFEKLLPIHCIDSTSM